MEIGRSAGDSLVPVWDGLGPCFSNFVNRHRPPETSVSIADSVLVGLGWRLRFCISCRLPDGTSAAGP